VGAAGQVGFIVPYRSIARTPARPTGAGIAVALYHVDGRGRRLLSRVVGETDSISAMADDRLVTSPGTGVAESYTTNDRGRLLLACWHGVRFVRR